MKHLYLSIGLLITVTILSLNSIAQTKVIPEQELQVGSGIFVSAVMTDATSEIELTMKGPADRWFGVGFGATMADADVLIYTDGKSTATHTLEPTDYNLSSQNVAGVTKDASQDWTVTNNTTNANVRTIVATRNLNTGDANDHVLNYSDATLQFIWAKASSANFTLAYHGSGNKGSIILSWEAPDVTPPTLAAGPFNPADDATGASVNTSLNVSFNENIKAGSGNIELREVVSGNIVETFDVQNNVSIVNNTLTATPSGPLANNLEYTVHIPSGAITDLSDNAYAGFTNNTTWNFTTAITSAGINENDLDLSFAMNEDKTLSINFETGNIVQVQLISISGQLLHSENYNSAKVTIDCAKYTNSIVVVNVNTEHGVVTKKINL